MEGHCFEGIWDISAFSDPMKIRGAQTQIETEVQSLLQQIAVLRRFGNTLVAVSRLPEELLGKIFVCLRDLNYTRSDAILATISQVCSHWRSTALACPRLWNNLDLLNTKWTEAKLQRSKHSPLTVYFGSLGLDASLTLALGSLARFRELSIHRLHLLQYLEQIQGCAPLLEVLTLRNDNPSQPMSYQAPPVEMPSLRHLTLDGCGLTWRSLSCSLLTHMELRNFRGYRPTWPEMISFIRDASKLRCLILTNALPRMSDLDHGTNSLSLPDRCSVTLTDAIPQCTELLKHLAISPSAQISVDCSTEQPDLSDVRSLMRSLAAICWSKYDTSVLLSASHVSLYGSGLASKMTLRCRDTMRTSESNFEGSVQLGLKSKTTVISATIFTSYALELFPLDYVKKLVLLNMDAVPMRIWHSQSSRLPRLTAISASGSPPYGFYDSLVERHAYNEDGGSLINPSESVGVVNFPELKHLYFTRMDFNRNSRGSEDSLVNSLQLILNSRQKTMIPITAILLAECEGLTRDIISWLEDEVVQVEVKSDIVDDDAES